MNPKMRRKLPKRGSTACWLFSVVVSLLGACGGGSGGSEVSAVIPEHITEPTKPNILLIMADDLGTNDISIFNGNPEIDTPNLDEFALQGVRFSRHYAYAVCSPARAAVLSGQHPLRNGYAPNGRGISPQLTTLPEALQAEGYNTWHIGKWHLGETVPQAWPGAQGFDHWFGFLNQWLLAGDPRNTNTVLSGPRYRNPWLVEDGDEGRYYDGHLEDILTDRALEVLASLNDEDAPWFMNLWFFAPHEPVRPSTLFAERYPDTAAGGFRALVSQLDFNIGRILDYLEQSGQSDHTLVVFVSDNGGTNKRLDNNFPFYGGKATFFEGAVRTPLIIRWPGGDGAGTVYDGVITLYDLYPSVMAAAGLPIPDDLDGIDIGPQLKQDTGIVRDLFWENVAGFAVRSADQKWLLTKNPWAASDEPLHLANLESDPAGAVNVIDDYPHEVVRLKQLHEHWHEKIHRVKVTSNLNSLGHGELTGTDFLRTPGYGAFTFAIGFERGFEGNLASQDVVWSLRSDIAGSVAVDFQGLQLSAPLLNSRNCYSVIVSARFSPAIPGIRGITSTYSINLYLDDVLVDSLSGEGELDVNKFHAPTVIGEPQAEQMDALLSEPILLGITLEDSPVWSAEKMGNLICPS